MIIKNIKHIKNRLRKMARFSKRARKDINRIKNLSLNRNATIEVKSYNLFQTRLYILLFSSTRLKLLVFFKTIKNIGFNYLKTLNSIKNIGFNYLKTLNSKLLSKIIAYNIILRFILKILANCLIFLDVNTIIVQYILIFIVLILIFKSFIFAKEKKKFTIVFFINFCIIKLFWFLIGLILLPEFQSIFILNIIEENNTFGLDTELNEEGCDEVRINTDHSTSVLSPWREGSSYSGEKPDLLIWRNPVHAVSKDIYTSVFQGWGDINNKSLNQSEYIKYIKEYNNNYSSTGPLKLILEKQYILKYKNISIDNSCAFLEEGSTLQKYHNSLQEEYFSFLYPNEDIKNVNDQLKSNIVKARIYYYAKLHYEIENKILHKKVNDPFLKNILYNGPFIISPCTPEKLTAWEICKKKIQIDMQEPNKVKGTLLNHYNNDDVYAVISVEFIKKALSILIDKNFVDSILLKYNDINHIDKDTYLDLKVKSSDHITAKYSKAIEYIHNYDKNRLDSCNEETIKSLYANTSSKVNNIVSTESPWDDLMKGMKATTDNIDKNLARKSFFDSKNI